MLARYFKFDELGTNLRTEILAGCTTFLTMAYIIFVNPVILSAAGMDQGALITATILASAFGTLLAGLWANVPFAMAPGMGLNAFFAYSLVLGHKVNWQTALGVVFLSGVLFMALTVCGVRSRVVRAIPLHLRLAIAAGIGLFIAFIGLQNLGLVVNHDVTLVALGHAGKPLLLGLAGLILILVLDLRRVRGSILIGILATTLLGIWCGEESVLKNLPLPPRDAVTGSYLQACIRSLFSAPPSLGPIALQLDIPGALKWSLLGAIFSFMFVDLFDSVGTIVACSYEAGLVKADGRIEKIDKILEADALATVAGALLGTSTTTTYIESGAGIAAGGKSGLASVVTALLFLLALLVTPVIGIVPSYATAPALVVVGIFMFKSASEIDFSDFSQAIPAFLTIALMPLTYSISTGLCFGFIAYIITQLAAGRAREIPAVMWIIAGLSALDVAISLR